MKQRNHFLDIAKGIAILMVLVTHFSWSDAERLKYLFPFWISMAVPIFMIISGYLSAASFQRNHVECLDDAYAPNLLWHKYLRFTVPFLIAYVVELCFDTYFHGLPSIQRVLLRGMQGGIGGCGTYYYPILIQFIFLFPVIYIIIKKKKHGLLLCFVMNAVYELLVRVYGMNYDCYRLLVFRYIMLIAFGCYLYLKGGNHLGKINWLMFFGGIAFIIIACYLEAPLPIAKYLKKTCVYAILFFLPVFSFLMEHLQSVKCGVLELLGKASYHIFFTQMVLYNYVSKRIVGYMPNRAFHLCFNIVFCVVVGLLFYYVETPISKKIMKASEGLFTGKKKNGEEHGGNEEK